MLLIEELKSCFKNEKLLISIAISLIFLFISQNQTYSSQENTPYSQAIESLSLDNVPENIQMLNNKIDELTLLVRFANNEISQEELFEIEKVKSLVQNYINEDYILLTGNPFDELKLYKSILKTNVSIRDFPINLLYKIDQLEKKIRSPLFQYSTDIRPLKMELAMLKRLTHVKPNFFVNISSVETFLNNNLSTYLLVFNMIIVLSVIILEDKKYQLNALFKTTRNGRSKHFLSKFAIICISGFFLSLLFYGIELLYATFNNLPLLIPIQTVNGFIEVYYPFSILIYWLISLVFRLLIVFTFILFIFSIFILIDNTMLAYGFVGLFALIEYLLTILISPNSKLIYLRQLSVFTIIDVKKVLGEIEFIVFGNLNTLYPLFILFLMFIIMLICFGLSLYGFVHIGKHRIKWNLPMQNFMKINKRFFFLEAHKVFYMNKSFLLFAILILFQILFFSNYQGPTQLDAYAYSTYIEPFKGPITEDVLDNIVNESQRFETLREYQTKLIEQRNNYEIGQETFLAEYFETRYELNNERHYQTLIEKLPSMITYGYIFDKTGYEYYFSITAETLALIYHMISVITIIIISIILVSTEIINHTKNMILSTLRKKEYIFNVFLILSLCIIVVLAITYLPQFKILNQYLKLTDFSAPLQAVFEETIPINIGSAYLILLINKVLVLGFYGGVSILLTRYFDRNIVIFLMLSLIGIDVLMYFYGFSNLSLFYFSSIYMLFDSPIIILLSMLVAFILLIFTFSSVYRYLSSSSE